ncbi:membrane protein insertase, YidC/Oxa1 family, C-terminal domain-containing protein [Ruminococcaceae bacterium YRB3002]|nr:membrane protein insertase, YidC/Oxa1 family, C-terminal domain-containing protein [Ruminococcaceae bacterium YRB3002]
MSIFDVLFAITIRPLELLFEFLFAVANSVTPNPAVNLIVMSLAINFIVLPLYRRADIIQQESRDTENRLRPVMDHIKKTFKGDEKVMMLQTYYRQQSYSPLSSMKSIISLVLQIPFFIAAYRFLSHLPLLEGVSMGPISNLNAPDGLITIGSLTINLLPILMTVINIISSEIYTKDQPFKSKIVLYLSAAIFLVLLYDSPSGLVFYWTFNNVFSLVKNIFYRLKNPGFVFKVMCAVTGVAGAVLCVVKRTSITPRQFVFLLIFCGALIVPLILHFILKDRKKVSKGSPLTMPEKMTYLFGAVYMSLLTGLLIPTAVISSSPDEFININDWNNPTKYALYALCIAIGVFIVWASVFYLLATDKGKKVFGAIAVAYSAVGTFNYMLFGTDLGTISPGLVYDETLTFTAKTMIINSLAVIAVAAVVIFVYKKKPVITQFVLVALSVVALGMGIMNIVSINKSYDIALSKSKVTEEPVITLSKTGKNVVVIMLDRAVGGFVPYLFNEDKNLANEYDGFTFYPNTISFGGFTNFGSPALYGGYEYTPENMNARADEPLVEKHNEALRVMPVLFSNNGFGVTFFNPTYANYSELADLTIFDEYEGIHAYTTDGVLNPYGESIAHQIDRVRRHHFFFYSIFKTSPVVAQESIYNGGAYHSLAIKYEIDDTDPVVTVPQYRSSNSTSTGVSARFINAFTALEAMERITQITDDSKDQLFIMSNDSTHEPILLQEPEYVPQNTVDNRQYDLTHMGRAVVDGKYMNLNTRVQMTHYHVNMAAYKQLGKWFDYLKSQGVWDNTRIIIVADHGRSLELFNDLQFDDIGLDVSFVNPTLMFKDFNSTGFTTSDEFMTNADVPTLATKGVIEDPVNPFTNVPLNNDPKLAGPQHIILSDRWKTTENNGNQFLPGRWYSVHDSIFDRDNWEFMGTY